MTHAKQAKARLSNFKRASSTPLFQLHPLFLLVGIYYAFAGELFLFLLSALVAIQHECAHAFAASALGYRLNKIILMPYGAVIDGDIKSLALKDEAFVAFCGPLCNLTTAGFFVALWWLAPTMYAFTDVACYSSLSIGLINLLPAYPLDGGRILNCLLQKFYLKRNPNTTLAQEKSTRICRIITLVFALLFFVIFIAFATQMRYNVSLLFFGIFLLVGSIQNKSRNASYERISFTITDELKKGMTVRRVAVLESCTLKQALRFLERGQFLVLSVYNDTNEHLFDLPQNQFSNLFSQSTSPYETLGELIKNIRIEAE